jgi:phosphoglycerate kinase
MENPDKPVTAVIGGAKLSGKIDLINNLLTNVDTVLIGGGMAGTFFKAMGKEIGDSLLEEDKIELAKSLLDSDDFKMGKMLLPVDVVIADDFDNNANKKVVSVDDVPAGWRILDIGPKTVDIFSEKISSSKTVFWNGPMGVFEMDNFAAGTRKVAEALVKVTGTGAITVVGGGDSASAIAKFGMAEGVSHISTGGGASLELMEGKMLPGVAAIM